MGESFPSWDGFPSFFNFRETEQDGKNWSLFYDFFIQDSIFIRDASFPKILWRLFQKFDDLKIPKIWRSEIFDNCENLM